MAKVKKYRYVVRVTIVAEEKMTKKEVREEVQHSLDLNTSCVWDYAKAGTVDIQ